MVCPCSALPKLDFAAATASFSQALPNGVTNRRSKCEPLKISSGTSDAYKGFDALCASQGKGRKPRPFPLFCPSKT